MKNKTEKVKPDGFSSFWNFKQHMLKQFPPVDGDLYLLGSSGGGSHKRSTELSIYPEEGGVIVLRDDGTWEYDRAAFAG